MSNKNTTDKILVILLKNPFSLHTATSLAKTLNLTRQGLWKPLKKLAEDKLIIINRVGNAKTSTSIIKLNWNNPITEKMLLLSLVKEASNQQRWMFNFTELENNVEFFILFGSILISQKQANDIDVLIIADKKNFKQIDEKILKIQKSQTKKIHLIDLTESEFNQELKRQNKAYIDAINKGVILYGQENFIKFIKNLEK
jgi:predicted nucleotidyltransferase